MQIKVGDLVYRKQHSYLNIRHNDEIWLVIGKARRCGLGEFHPWIQIENIHNGNRISCKEPMLMKI